MAKQDITWSNRYYKLTPENVRSHALSSAGVPLLYVKLENDRWRLDCVDRARQR